MSKLSRWWRRNFGPLLIRGMEIHVINHCNIACRGCNHAAPALEKKLLEPEELRAQLRLLGRVARVGTVRVIGGEPLLHPRIDDALHEIRASGLFAAVHVITNGSLLGRMTERFWSLVDVVKVSKYPGVKVEVPPGREGKVTIDDIPVFNEVFSTQRNEDGTLVRQIWDRCWMKDSCIGLQDGRLHRCMRGGYIAQLVGLSADRDSIDLRRLTRRRLLAMQSRDVPLEACSYCTGNSGKPFAHELLKRPVWITYQNRPVAEMVDLSSPGRPASLPKGERIVVPMG